MVSKVLSVRGKAAMVAGLSWHPLIAPLKKRSAEIRGYLAESEVDRIALTEVNSNHMLGMFVSGDMDEDSEKAKPSKLHSIALAFSSFVGSGNAVLAYAIPNSSLAAIVLIESGIPNLDDVKMVEQVQVMLDNYSNGSMGFVYNPYTNDQNYFPNASSISDDDLWENTSNKTLLTRKPINTKALLSFVLFSLLIASCYYGYSYYDKNVKAKQREIERLKTDPVLNYSKTLESKIGDIGISTENVLAIIKSFEDKKIRDSGWSLISIDCSVVAKNCISTWNRDSGFTDNLIESRLKSGDVVVDGYDLNKVSFIIKSPLASSGVGSPLDLPLFYDFNKSITRKYQKIKYAGIAITVDPKPNLWPNDAGIDISSIPEDKRITNQLTVINTSLFMGKELIQYLPSNYYWTDISISFSQSSTKPSESLTLSLKGSNYVRQK